MEHLRTATRILLGSTVILPILNYFEIVSEEFILDYAWLLILPFVIGCTILAVVGVILMILAIFSTVHFLAWVLGIDPDPDL